MFDQARLNNNNTKRFLYYNTTKKNILSLGEDKT